MRDVSAPRRVSSDVALKASCARAMTIDDLNSKTFASPLSLCRRGSEPAVVCVEEI